MSVVIASAASEDSGELRAQPPEDDLNAAREPEFESLVTIAALACGAPIALLALCDSDRRWVQAQVGLQHACAPSCALALHACGLDRAGLLEVPDTRESPQFAALPAVTGAAGIRFYAGRQLQLRDGSVAGELCVLDRVPRRLDAAQAQILDQLARTAALALEKGRDLRSHADSEAAYRVLNDSAADAIVSVDAAQCIVVFNRAAEAMFLCAASTAKGQSLDRFIPERFRESHAAHLPRFGEGPTAARAMHSPGRLFGLRSDGSEFPIEASISTAQVRGATLYTAVLRDVSERVRLETQIAGRTRESAAANLRLEIASDQLRVAQRISKVGSWGLDVGSGALDWSEELFRITGLDPQRGPPALEAQERFYTADSWRHFEAGVTNCLLAGTAYELELELRLASGDTRWAVARGEAERDATGAIARLAGTLQDVTELKRARLDMEKLSQRLRIATTSAGVGVWEWNLQTGTLAWDDEMLRLYGLKRADFHGTNADFLGAVHPEDLARVEQTFADTVAGESTWNADFRICPYDGGAIRSVQAHGVFERSGSADAGRMLGTNWDVTKQREAALALIGGQNLLREFVKHAPAAIAMLDRDLRYVQTSDRWLVEYGLTGQDLTGRLHHEVLPDLPERWEQMHRRVLEGASEHCDEDPFLWHGNQAWLQWEARPWRAADGSVGGLIMFTKTITASKEMELLLRSQQLELARSNAELEQFANVASHDLQEPLRAVAGCAQLLAASYRGRLDADADQLIAHVVEGAERMRALIQGLLALSRVTSHASEPAYVDCAAACQTALANLATSIQESGALVQVDALPCVSGDHGQLVQLFQNLIGNALKYRDARRPEIRIRCEATPTEYVFAVEDNGIGIAPEYFERIFVVFQRLHTRTDYPGTGIGLAICNKVVQRHHGRLWVESTPGKGTTFRFSLPRSQRRIAA